MGMMDRIAARLGYEKRAGDDPSWSDLAPGIGYLAGVSARAADTLSTVLARVTAISPALAYVTALAYRRDRDCNRNEATDHPPGRTLRGVATPQMTWPDWLEHWIASALLTGNGLSVVDRSGNGQLAGFRYIPWSMVTVAELSSGRLAYDVSDGRGNTRRYLEGEVLHLRDRTDDGKIGRSRLSRAAETVAGVSAANTHAATFLANGAAPSGVIEVPGIMKTEQRSELRDSFQSRQDRKSTRLNPNN